MSKKSKNSKSDIIEETDKAIKKSIGKRIKDKRNSKNLSAETLASKIGISRSSLSQIENGKNNVNALILWKLACRLECSVDDFFPKIPEGYGLSKIDLTNIAKEDEKAVEWGEVLFGVKNKKKNE